eukprot:7386868-Prymnesium_polylepis.2
MSSLEIMDSVHMPDDCVPAASLARSFGAASLARSFGAPTAGGLFSRGLGRLGSACVAMCDGCGRDSWASQRSRSDSKEPCCWRLAQSRARLKRTVMRAIVQQMPKGRMAQKPQNAADLRHSSVRAANTRPLHSRSAMRRQAVAS